MKLLVLLVLLQSNTAITASYMEMIEPATAHQCAHAL
jgi:hypothetical protein